MAESEASVAEALEVEAPTEAPALAVAVDPKPKDGEPAKPSEATLEELFGADPEKAQVGEDDTPTPQADEPEAKDKEQPKAKEEPQEEDEELSAAFQALLTSGVPASVLKNASKADLLKWSQKQAKREADIQLAFQERANLKKQIDDKAKETAAKTSEPSSGVPTDNADLKALLATVSETYGEGLGKTLEGLSTRVVEMALSAVEKKYADQMGGLSTRALVAQELLLEHTKARLVDRFPKLSDDSEFEKVIEKTKALAATGAYDAPTIRGQAFSAMSDACGLVFGVPASTDGQHKKEVNRSKDNSQPKLTTPRIPGAPQTFEKKAWAAFNAAEDGDENKARMIMSQK